MAEHGHVKIRRLIQKNGSVSHTTNFLKNQTKIGELYRPMIIFCRARLRVSET